MIEVITDKETWNELLEKVENSDFYHSYDYHQLSKKEDESPVLIKYTDGLTTLVLPLLVRPIENSDFKDATSVYGYAGLLALHIGDEFKKDNFHTEFKALCLDHKIVSVFSRLHPFIDYQEELHEGLGTVTALSKVVYKDLSESLEEQRAKYNRRLKTYLNKSRKLCTVIEGNIKEHLESFIHLYTENMKRVDADESYFFDNAYFHKLLASKDIESKLMLCKLNETQDIIAGAIFIKTDNIVQYHLSGLDDEHFELNPIKLIIDEMRIEATNEGYRYFNLGGGRGSKEDSLFRFKSGFSKDFKTFKIWKYIVDENIYTTLTENHLGTPLENENLNEGFFPAYRAPINTFSN